MHIPKVSTGPVEYPQKTSSSEKRRLTDAATQEDGDGSAPSSSSGNTGITSDLPRDTISINSLPVVLVETHAERLQRLHEAVDKQTYSVSSSALADKLIKAGVAAQK